MRSDKLWAITSYYNPAGYRRRLDNFRAFRRNLCSPLLVVELAPDGCAALRDDDADLVVHVSGDDRLWQKERLLNLATALLPPHVRHVAWIDADVLLPDPDWPTRASAILDRHGGMVQLFDAVHHLPPDIDPQSVTIAHCAVPTPFPWGISMARSVREGRFEQFERAWGQRSSGIACDDACFNATGFAWAARREALMACGLYDGNVVGGSDTLAALALLGRLEETWLRRAYSEAHKAHVRQWAQAARRGGLLAHCADLPQTASHLWHGAMADRNYVGRYQILAGHAFDPARDLIAEPGRPLRWTDPDSALAQDVATYFFARREDGG